MLCFFRRGDTTRDGSLVSRPISVPRPSSTRLVLSHVSKPAAPLSSSEPVLARLLRLVFMAGVSWVVSLLLSGGVDVGDISSLDSRDVEGDAGGDDDSNGSDRLKALPDTLGRRSFSLRI